MSGSHEKGNTMSRRGDDEIRRKIPLCKPLKANESGAVEKRASERGTFVEEVYGVIRLRAGTSVGPNGRGGRVGRGGHRGCGRTHNGGRGRRGQGCRILNLLKQGALHILTLLTECSVLTVPRGREDILGGDMEGFRP